MINFPIEPYKLSSWANSKGFAQCYLYLGPSMNPTFQSGDLLYTRPVPQKLFRGDVIVFADTKMNGFIVHRIVRASFDSLITKGDHNHLCDPPLKLDQVVGKVELVENKAGRKQVINGSWGLRMAQIRYFASQLDPLLRQIFRVPYQLLRKSGVVSVIWRPSIVIIHLQSEGQTLVKYIYKHRTVAVWNSALQQFDCLKPFDLIITSPEGSKEYVLVV